MPKLIPDDQWKELQALAGALLDRAREITTAQHVDAGESPGVETVMTECQAMNAAVLALAQSCPLAGAEMFLGMGGAMGIVLAQQVDDHPTLLAFRAQMRGSYNEIAEAHRPKGNA